jgi:hypothetical protein
MVRGENINRRRRIRTKSSGSKHLHDPARCEKENSIDGEGNDASSRGSSGNEDFHMNYDRWDLANGGESAEL